MEHQTEDDASVEFVPLGDAPGPALPLPPAREQALVTAAVRRVRRAGSVRYALQAAASVLLALGLAGAAAAAVATYLSGDPPRKPFEVRRSEPPGDPIRLRRPARPPAPAVAAQERASEPLPPALAPAPERAAASSRDLLQRANRLRARGEWQKAERVYAEVARSSAVPHDAYAARVAAASLRLERLGDPRRALELFRAALREQPRGALAEEARFGIAECQRALGDRAAEAQALRELLALHPASVLRDKANARLKQISVPE